MKVVDYKKNIEMYDDLMEYFIVEQEINLDRYSIKKCKEISKGKIEFELEEITLYNVIKEALCEKEKRKIKTIEKYNLNEGEFEKYETEFRELSNDFFYCRSKKDYKNFIAESFEKRRTSIQDIKKFRFFYDLTLENYIKAIKDNNFNIKEIRIEEKEKEER